MARHTNHCTTGALTKYTPLLKGCKLKRRHFKTICPRAFLTHDQCRVRLGIPVLVERLLEVHVIQIWVQKCCQDNNVQYYRLLERYGQVCYSVREACKHFI